MKALKKALILFLSLLLCLSLAGCTEEQNKKTDETETGISASDAGIVTYGKFLKDDFASSDEFDAWFALAQERDQITNALILSRDEGDGLWHCRLYVGSFADGDTLAFGANGTDSTVLIRHIASTPESNGSPYLFYFTIDRDEEPEFEFFQNDTFAGLLVTVAEGSMKQAQTDVQ